MGVGGGPRTPTALSASPRKAAGDFDCTGPQKSHRKIHFKKIRLGNLFFQYSLVMRKVATSISKQRAAFSASCLSGGFAGLSFVLVKLLS